MDIRRNSRACLLCRGSAAVEETLGATEDLLSKHKQSQFDVLYLTGGGSELPLIARMLRERFGRRVRRSAYTRSATAIGLTIQADRPDTYGLSEQLSRYFGVWREADQGSRIAFDPLFFKGTQLPASSEPALRITREYSPVHNIGHFRFLECSHRTANGEPTGEVTLWDDIRFPFDPKLAELASLESERVLISSQASLPRIQESYECDSSGSSRLRSRTVYRAIPESTVWDVGLKTRSPFRRCAGVRSQDSVLRPQRPD